MLNRDTARKWKSICYSMALALFFTTAGLFLPTLIVALFVFFPSYDDIPALFRRLPTDEEMIANFREHKGDFERLAFTYRNDLSVPGTYSLEPTPEISTIMARIKVAGVNGDGVIWMPPDPYATNNESRRAKEAFKIESYHRPEGRKLSGVIFTYAHKRVITAERLEPVYKRYYYTPIVPRTDNGALILPEVGTRLTPDPRIAETLDVFPPNFGGAFNCVYKQIEPHWFIGMCQGE